MSEAYTHVKGTYPVDTPYTKLEDTDNRGQVFKLKKERAAKTVLFNFFSLRINNTRNKLPSHVVDAPA